MFHRSFRLALASGFMLIASTATMQIAQAQTPVFGNFNSSQNRSAGVVTPTFFWSERFATGSKGVSVGSVDATLARLSSSDPATTTMSFGIYSNNGNGNPGALLFSFGTQNVPNEFGEIAPNYTFAPGGAYTLLAGTTYHLVARGVNGGVAWIDTNPTTTVPTASNGSEITHGAMRFTENSGASWETRGNTLRFQLNAAVTVPEANTLALALPALGMVGSVVLRRRKK